MVIQQKQSMRVCSGDFVLQRQAGVKEAGIAHILQKSSFKK